MSKENHKKGYTCDCGQEMKVVDTRDDGCRYFECPSCGNTLGEETKEWFDKMKEYCGSV